MPADIAVICPDRSRRMAYSTLKKFRMEFIGAFVAFEHSAAVFLSSRVNYRTAADTNKFRVAGS